MAPRKAKIELVFVNLPGRNIALRKAEGGGVAFIAPAPGPRIGPSRRRLSLVELRVMKGRVSPLLASAIMVFGLAFTPNAAIAQDPDHGCEFPSFESNYDESKAEVAVVIHLAECFPDARDFVVTGTMSRDAVAGEGHDVVKKKCRMNRAKCRTRLRIEHDPVDKATYYGYFSYLGHLKNGKHESGSIEFQMKCVSFVLTSECSPLFP